jgi:hypothetical protein
MVHQFLRSFYIFDSAFQRDTDGFLRTRKMVALFFSDRFAMNDDSTLSLLPFVDLVPF